MQTFNLYEMATKYVWKTNELAIFFKEVVGFASLNFTHKVWLAGGALRRTILSESIIDESDFDLFFENNDSFEAVRKALKDGGATLLHENLYNETYLKEVTILKGDTDTVEETITFKVQLIKIQYYTSLEEVLKSFDYTICQFGVQLGKDAELLCGDTSLYDLGRKRLVVNRVSYPVATLRRLIKYTKQGFYACDGTLTELLKVVAQNPNLLNETPKYID